MFINISMYIYVCTKYLHAQTGPVYTYLKYMQYIHSPVPTFNMHTDIGTTHTYTHLQTRMYMGPDLYNHV